MHGVGWGRCELQALGRAVGRARPKSARPTLGPRSGTTRRRRRQAVAFRVGRAARARGPGGLGCARAGRLAGRLAGWRVQARSAGGGVGAGARRRARDARQRPGAQARDRLPASGRRAGATSDRVTSFTRFGATPIYALTYLRSDLMLDGFDSNLSSHFSYSWSIRYIFPALPALTPPLSRRLHRYNQPSYCSGCLNAFVC